MRYIYGLYGYIRTVRRSIHRCGAVLHASDLRIYNGACLITYQGGRVADFHLRAGSGACKAICERTFYNNLNQNIKEEFVAVKKIFKDKIKKQMKYKYKKSKINEEDFKSEIRKFNKEINNMEICQCENSVKIYDYYDTENEFIIVMELCDKNLMDVLSEKEHGFNVEEIKSILLQLNNAFKIMKENKILHRDIKTNNILVKYLNKEKTKYKVLLCDYGISRQIASMTRNYMSHVGTHCYTAPEILNDEIYSYKCDLWSLGITIYEMYTRELPYEAESEKGLLNQIDEKGQTIFEVIKDDKLKNLLMKLLEKDQKKRISWDDYFKDPFFEEKPNRDINSYSIY